VHRIIKTHNKILREKHASDFSIPCYRTQAFTECESKRGKHQAIFQGAPRLGCAAAITAWALTTAARALSPSRCHGNDWLMSRTLLSACHQSSFVASFTERVCAGKHHYKSIPEPFSVIPCYHCMLHRPRDSLLV